MITNSDIDPAYEPFDFCDECGYVLRGREHCPICNDDGWEEEWAREDMERKAADDTVQVLREIHLNNAAFLEMTPWDTGMHAILRRQAD